LNDCVRCTDESNRPPFKRRNTNPFTEGYDPSLVEGDAQQGTQTTADGATVVPAYQSVEPEYQSVESKYQTVVPDYQSVEPSRAWENMGGGGGGGTADGPRIPSGEASAFLAPQRRQRRGSDSDADSEDTEGCDEIQDLDEESEETEGCDDIEDIDEGSF